MEPNPPLKCCVSFMARPVPLRILHLARVGGAALAIAAVSPVGAQRADAPTGEAVIVVTGERLRGEVIGDIPPETELGEADIAGYGASSIEDLLDAIAPQTGSARGRGGGGRPVILLNGQRISGFRELRDLPPEAILRVQIFPEELALRYGFRPDQRVVNFILKPNFAAISGEIERGGSTAGGYAQTEIEATFTRIDSAGRLNVDLEYEPSSAILESERGIVQPRVDDLGLVDIGDFRTLRPKEDQFEINASYNRRLSEAVSATLSGEHTRTDTLARLGLPGASLTVPATSPFARQPGDETLFRYLPVAGGVLERDTTTRNSELGLTVNGQAGEWRWSLTGNYARAERETVTDRSDLSGLVARIAAGDPALDPFAADLGRGFVLTRDTADSLTQNVDANATIAGSPFLMPAGPVSVSATAGYDLRTIDSESVGSGVATRADLSRHRGFARGTIELPLTSRRDNVLPALGDISVNANIGYGELSDFGGLFEYGYGLRWEPIEGLSLLASVIGEEAAPSVAQLGDPAIVTPNVSLFDFGTGQSVLVDRISGGNPALLAESRRDFKLTANYSFGENPEIRLLGEYIRNRSENVSSDFPLLTPEIEAAFPGRVTRDMAGNLVSVDARPVDFAEVRSERIRYGASLSGDIGGAGSGERDRRNGERRPGGGDAQGETPPQGAEARRGGPRSPMRMLRGRRGGDGGRWRLSLFHTYRIDETVLIRPGIPELDLLGGSVTGGSTPISRHGIELEGGVFFGGIGLRISGEYTGSARVDGGGQPGAADLRFGDLATLDARAFFNFDSRPALVEDLPFLAGSRLALRIDNVFGGIRRVEDANGSVPLAFQPGFLDPRGRYIEFSFRKRF